jgi:predicted HicB family RNase H-like nuclease
MKTLIYKGQIGSVEISTDDDCLYGKLLFINPLITYEATTAKELQEEFEKSVDDYMNTCTDLKRDVEKPCKGSFNVRVGHELHARVSIAAKEYGVSLNDWVKRSLAKAV